ncbi:ferric iron reductase [Paracoccus sp. (in: a-proteobacteria)]|uniref:ferric iron reductase n=1 Tax=Paracoccus sp. TaxID=267 RepID=UPI00396CDF89
MDRLPGFGPMRLVGDPHWLMLRLPDMTESGFELILRDKPWRSPHGGRMLQVGGLYAAAAGQLSLKVQARAGLNPDAGFRAYLDCAPVLLACLYDAFGIGLEAHQRNTLLDLSADLPIRCDYCDDQGVYVARDPFDAAMRDIPTDLPPAEVEDVLTHTLLFGVIQRMSLDNLLP